MVSLQQRHIFIRSFKQILGQLSSATWSCFFSSQTPKPCHIEVFIKSVFFFKKSTRPKHISFGDKLMFLKSLLRFSNTCSSPPNFIAADNYLPVPIGRIIILLHFRLSWSLWCQCCVNKFRNIIFVFFYKLKNNNNILESNTIKICFLKKKANLDGI